MNEKLEKFKELLKEIFEMDKSDLDFGIYRIINLRKDKIEDFIDNKLPNEISNILKTTGDSNKTEELASDVYSALYNFFNRYYDEGDFISKRRYKEGVYAIPYEGEEVKLYWANYDQYYIKTSENFKDYEFKTSDGITCKFKLIDVTTEQNNNKEKDDEKRKFMLYKKGDSEDKTIETFSYDKENKVLTICFIYDIPESKNTHIKSDELEQDIKEWIDSNAGDIGPSIFAQQDVADKKTKTLLKKHLDAYIAKNTFDYFIHKDLKKFLDRELDFFIKTEIMHLDDLNTENEKQIDQYILKVKAIKKVGQVIIDFLASVENFQKKLWLKKKFIIETNWCITLDKISDDFYEEIRNNKEQVNEWIDLYAINEVDGFTEVPSIEFIKKNSNLIIDTKNFSKDFKERLLSTIEDLDDNTNGLLINGDNNQSMQLIKNVYKEKIKCAYLDPPYNTNEVSFKYKNNYKRSSWASMMYDRTKQAFNLLSNDGGIMITIDDFELYNLKKNLDVSIGEDNYIGTIVIQSNPRGRSTNSYYATSHEYCICYAKDPNDIIIVDSALTEEQEAGYKNNDGESSYRLLPFRRSGGWSTPLERPNSEFSIFFSEGKLVAVGGDRKGNINEEYEEKDILVLKDDEVVKIDYESLDKMYDNLIRILPIDTSGSRRVWRWSDRRKILHHGKNGDFVLKKDNDKYYVQLKDRIKLGRKPKTVWVDSKYDSSSNGTNVLKMLFGERNLFGFPKSVFSTKDSLFSIIGDDEESYVLDIFGGSATTVHALIKINREKSVNNKYILVEMGNYFDIVTLPRVKKVVISDEWENGKPKTYNNGISQLIKHFSIESYEDALSNITINTGLFSLFSDNIEYMIDLDTKDSLLSLDKFKRPFDYKMKITSKNETKETNVDMVETFNYLIGLTVKRQYATRYFNVGEITDSPYKGAISLKEISFNEANNHTIRFKEIYGILRDGRKVAILWRDINDNLENSNAALDAFFINHMNSKEFDVLFINGDNNVQNLKKDNDNWNTELIEPIFNELMFEEE